ncbi:MAG: GIY-YIG nuclease family protein [Raoultibacter sp.]|jgi:hypothetical protein
MKMDKERRKELKAQAGQVKTKMGIYQLKNKRNGKIYLASSSNLKNQDLRLRMRLNDGRHINAELQKDWDAAGDCAEAEFLFEILDEYEVEDDMDVKRELEKLEEAWLDQVSPYGEKGYMRKKTSYSS